MADNYEVTEGTGTIMGSKEISSVQYPRVRISTGNTPDDVDDSHPFPTKNTDEVADNAGFTDGTTKVKPAGFIFDEVAGTALTENDAAAARIDSKRAQISVIEDETTRGRRATVTAGNALKVDNSAVTQPISDGGGSITVDGSVTCNAGTNLNTSSLALESGGNLATIAGAIRAEDAASGDGHTGVVMLAVRKATPANTSGTDGDYEMPQMSAGRLWTSATIDAALPAGTNAIGKLAANSGVDIGDIDVTSVVPGTSASSLGKAEDAAAASGDTGVAALFVRRDTIASSTSNDGDYAVPSVTDLGELYTQVTASAKNGYTLGKVISASGNNKTSIKGSAGTLGFLTVSNTNASARYLKLYNVASGSVTVGTTVPDLTFLIPGNANGAGSNIPIPTQGLAFGTAITMALTTGAADNDSGSVAASEIIVNYGYK